MSIRIGNKIPQIPLVGARKTQAQDDKFLTEGDTKGFKAQEESKIIVPTRSLYTPEVLSHQFYNPLLFALVPGADKDVDRYKDIMKGKARRELLKFKDPSEFIGRREDKLVSVPVPGINIPRFTRGRRESGGVGQGEGKSGQPIGKGSDPDGAGKAGENEGNHIKEELVP